jgi:hypothetical protein
MQHVSKQLLGKHVLAGKRRTQQYSYNGIGGVFCWVRPEVMYRGPQAGSVLTRVEAGFEYLHRDPASRRRR